MDTLVKTLRKLDATQYQALIAEVAPNRKGKPFMVLEHARSLEFSDSKMIKELEVNPNAYYTLKSRLNTKVASVLSKQVETPIRALMEEVAQVQAHTYTSNRSASIRVLKDLEKQLLEYDLNYELIGVYRTLAHLHLHCPEHAQYNRLYNRYVAFNLSVVKAEGLFFEFTRCAGEYQGNPTPANKESMHAIVRELKNISELYEGHRLYVYHSLVKIAYTCLVSPTPEALASMEVEFEEILTKVRNVFDRYNRDTFYANIGFIVDYLFLDFYNRVGNTTRALKHYKVLVPEMHAIAGQSIFNFYLCGFLTHKLILHASHPDEVILNDLDEALNTDFDTHKEELYHILCIKRFKAALAFIEGSYKVCTTTVHQARNMYPSKTFSALDLDLKLMAATSYLLQDEIDMCATTLSSATRTLNECEEGIQIPARAYIKLLKYSSRSASNGKKLSTIKKMYFDYREVNKTEFRILKGICLKDTSLQTLANLA